jgi:hypothetical protein
MGFLAVLVPAAWWGRYTLGMPAAALICLAVVHDSFRTRRLQVALVVMAASFTAAAVWHDPLFTSLWRLGLPVQELHHFSLVYPAVGFSVLAVANRLLPPRVMQVVLSAAASLLLVMTYADSVMGYRALPTPFADEATKVQDEQRLRGEAHWLWPFEAARFRDASLKPGDVVTYDAATAFLGEYWTPDLRNRVEYVEDKGDDDLYIRELSALKPVWVSVRGNSRGEAVLRAHPDVFQFLFAAPISEARVYRVLRHDW